MAVAFDTVSNAGATFTGDVSWTHTPSGTTRGVYVTVFNFSISAADEVTGVTYGGVPLTRVSPSSLFKATGEPLGMAVYFGGAGFASGPQTVAITMVGSPVIVKAGLCRTFTGATDLEIIDDVTWSSDALANPTGTLVLGGRSAACLVVLLSGQNTVSGFTQLTNWSIGSPESDFGNFGGGEYTYNVVGTADVTTGWTQLAEDAVGMALAIGEVGGLGVTGTTIASGAVLQAGTVTPGAVTRAGATIASTAVLHAGTVTPPAVSLTGATIASTAIVRVGTVTATRLVAGAAIAASAVLFAGTVTPGAVSVGGATVASGATLFPGTAVGAGVGAIGGATVASTATLFPGTASVAGAGVGGATVASGATVFLGTASVPVAGAIVGATVASGATPFPGTVVGAAVGDATIPLAPLTVTGVATVAIDGIATIPLAPLTTTATGTVSEGILAAATITLAPVTSSGAGAVTIEADAFVELALLTTQATGEVAIDGAATITLEPLTAVGAATGPVSIVITPTTLPNPRTDLAYAQQLVATGGNGGPFTFTLASGSMPPGLTLSTDGRIAGTVTDGAELGPTGAWPIGVVDTPYAQQLVLIEGGLVGTVYPFTIRVVDSDEGGGGEEGGGGAGSALVATPLYTTPGSINIVTTVPTASENWIAAYGHSFNGTATWEFRAVATGEFRMSGQFLDDGSLPAAAQIVEARLQCDYAVSFTNWQGSEQVTLMARRDLVTQASVVFGAAGGSGRIDQVVPMATRAEAFDIAWGWGLRRPLSGVSGVHATLTIANFRLVVTYTLPAADSRQAADQAYTLTIESGWTSDAFFDSVDGARPPKCLRCTPTGLITGMPMTVGTFPFSVRVTNALGATLTETFTLTVRS